MAIETSLTSQRIEESVRAGLWRNESLETYLDRWATARPDKLAVFDRVQRHTWSGLARLVERVAHGLRAHGVEHGGVISCQLPNWSEFALIFLAASRLGAVVHPIPPTYRASELRFILGLLEAQVLVIPDTFRAFHYPTMVAGLREQLPRLEHVFVARGGAAPAGMLPFSVLTEAAWEARAGRTALPGADPNTV